MWDPILMKVLMNFVLMGPVNSARDPLFKMQMRWKTFSTPSKLTHIVHSIRTLSNALNLYLAKTITQFDGSSFRHTHTHTHTHTHIYITSVTFSKYKFNNKLLSDVILLKIIYGIHLRNNFVCACVWNERIAHAKGIVWYLKRFGYHCL